jgi:hypothetical protein
MEFVLPTVLSGKSAVPILSNDSGDIWAKELERRFKTVCVADAFHLEFPAPNGIYMGHRCNLYAAEMVLESDTTSETQLEESYTSSGTRQEESDNMIVGTDSDADSVAAPLFEDREEVVVPETDETLAVIVPKTQETVVDLLPHDVINPRPNSATFKYGGLLLSSNII